MISFLTLAILRYRLYDIDLAIKRALVCGCRYNAPRTVAAFAGHMRDEVDVERLTGQLVSVGERTITASTRLAVAKKRPGGQPAGFAAD